MWEKRERGRLSPMQECSSLVSQYHITAVRIFLKLIIMIDMVNAAFWISAS